MGPYGGLASWWFRQLQVGFVAHESPAACCSSSIFAIHIGMVVCVPRLLRRCAEDQACTTSGKKCTECLHPHRHLGNPRLQLCPCVVAGRGGASELLRCGELGLEPNHSQHKFIDVKITSVCYEKNFIIPYYIS